MSEPHKTITVMAKDVPVGRMFIDLATGKKYVMRAHDNEGGPSMAEAVEGGYWECKPEHGVTLIADSEPAETIEDLHGRWFENGLITGIFEVARDGSPGKAEFPHEKIEMDREYYVRIRNPDSGIEETNKYATPGTKLVGAVDVVGLGFDL